MSVLSPKIYDSAYLRHILPHKNKIDEIILNMDINQGSAAEAGFAARILQEKSILVADREKYFSKNHRNVVTKTLLTNFPHATNSKLTILDVGCGYGEYMAVLAALGHKVLGTNGLQYSEDFQFVNKLLNLEIILHDLKNGLPLADKSVDAIIAYGVITLKCFKNTIPSIIEEFNRVAKKYVAIRIHAKTLAFHNLQSPMDIAPNNVEILVNNSQDITWEIKKKYRCLI